MTTPDSNDLEGDTTARLTAARAKFLQTDNAYAVDGRELERRVLEQLRPYHDTAQNRARIIQDFTRELSYQIDTFIKTRADEMSKLMWVYLDALLAARTAASDRVAVLMTVPADWVEQARQRLQLNLMSAQTPGPQGAAESEIAVDAIAARERLLDRLGELTEIIHSANAIAEWGFNVATGSLLLRQAVLEGYLGSVPLVKHANSARSYLKAIVEEAPLAGLAIAGDALVAAVPLGTIAVSILNVVNRVKETVDAMTEHYERGPIDEMFDFGQAIYDEQEVHEAVSELLDTLSTNLKALAQASKIILQG